MFSTFGKQRNLLFSTENSFASGAEPKWIIVGQNVTPLLVLEQHWV